MHPDRTRVYFHHDESQTTTTTTTTTTASPQYPMHISDRGPTDRLLPSLVDQFSLFDPELKHIKDMQMIQCQMQYQMQYQMHCQMQYQLQLMRMSMGFEANPSYPQQTSTSPHQMSPLKQQQLYQSPQTLHLANFDLATPSQTQHIPRDRMLPLPIPSSMPPSIHAHEIQVQVPIQKHAHPTEHESTQTLQTEGQILTHTDSQKSLTFRPIPKLDHLCSLVQLSLREKATVKRMTPYNSFVIYMLAHRDELRKADPFLSNKDLTKRLAEEWAEVPPSQKSQYRKLARDLTLFRDGHPPKKSPNGGLPI